MGSAAQIGYKAVNFSNGKLVSFHKPALLCNLNKQIKTTGLTDLDSNLYRTIEDAVIYTKLARIEFAIILKCKYHKPIKEYEFTGKFSASAVIPIEVVGIFNNGEYIKQSGNSEWLLNHLSKYPNASLPPQSAVITYGKQTIRIEDCPKVKRGKVKELVKALKATG
jgi:hypothetical protein